MVCLNTYINGVFKYIYKWCSLNKFLKIPVSNTKEKNMQNYAQIDNID